MSRMDLVIYVLVLTITATLVSSLGNQDSASETKGFFNGPTTGFEATNGFDVQTKLHNNGLPSGHINLSGGIKVGPGAHPQQYREEQDPSQIQVQPQPQYFIQQAPQPYGYGQSSSVWLPSTSTILSASAYFAAGIAAAASIWYSCGYFGYSKKSLSDLEEVKEKDEKVKSRRRRSIEADESLTNLASMVLAAIESGDCLQKSICLLGAQVGTRKGRLAANLLDKMLPTSVQGSPYFVTFRNSLKGETYCNKMRCKH